MSKTGVTAEQKAELKQAGLWDDFWRFRQEKREDGATPAQARAEAWEHVNDRLEAWRNGQPITAPDPEPVEPGSEAKKPAAQEDDQLAALNSEQRHEFFARKVRMIEVVDWVAGRLRAPDEWLHIMDAPSAAAWGMLMDARRSEARKANFWDRYWSTLPPKSKLGEEEGNLSPDGEAIVAAIDRLIDTGKFSKGNSGVDQPVDRRDHAPEDVGSTPTPATEDGDGEA